MYIGQVAKLCDVSKNTLRYYEEQELLINVKRKGNYRIYHDDHVKLVNLIKQAQSLGFTLSQIKQALIEHHYQPNWSIILTMLQTKKDDNQDLIQQLLQSNKQINELN